MGLGGLGHMGVKYARAFGAHVVVFTTSPNKKEDALRLDGNLTLVRAPEKPFAVSALGLIWGRRSLSGSNIGGIAETQEMLDFCGAHDFCIDMESLKSE